MTLKHKHWIYFLLITFSALPLAAAGFGRPPAYGFPPLGVMLVGMLIPILGIIGFFTFLIIFIKLYHIRVMALIEKGKYEPKPVEIKWDLIFLFIGLLLSLIAVALSIYKISIIGFQAKAVTEGIVPFFIGIGFLVFYKIYSAGKNKS